MENASVSSVSSRPQQGNISLVTLIAVACLSVIIVLTLFGNIIVLYAFCHFRKLRTPAHFFIASLALSDLLVGVVTIPMWLSFEVTRWQNLPEWMDIFMLIDIWTCIDIICSAASISNLLMIAVDRCIAVTIPLWHRHHVTRRVVRRLIVLAWLYAVIPAVVYLQKWVWKYVVILILAFGLPLILITSFYLYIILVAKRKKRRLQSDFKIAKTFGIVTGTFFITWMPFFVWSIIVQYCGMMCRHFTVEFRYNMTSLGKVLHYSNSCFNPVIYAYHSQPFKAAFIKLLREWGCRNSQLSYAPSISSYRSFRSRYNSVEKNTLELQNRRRQSENTCELGPEGNSTQVILNNCKAITGGMRTSTTRSDGDKTNPSFQRTAEINSFCCKHDTKNTDKKMLRANKNFSLDERSSSQKKRNVTSDKGTDPDRETNV